MNKYLIYYLNNNRCRKSLKLEAYDYNYLLEKEELEKQGKVVLAIFDNDKNLIWRKKQYVYA
jgi:hypothetical protein